VIHQNGMYSFGFDYYSIILDRHGVSVNDYNAKSKTDREQYDNEVRELIVSMLILKGSKNNRARNELQQQLFTQLIDS
jgi:predicted transcriptional regulator